MSVQRILIPVAPEQPMDGCFEQILTGADKLKAKVKLFSVIDDLTPARVANHLRLSPWALLKMAQEQQLAALDEKAVKLAARFPSVHFETEVASGMPFLKIIELADRENFDLIAIGAKRTENSSIRFGSTTRHLMRKSPVPVWSVSMRDCRGLKRVAAAVDVDAPTDAGIQLNERIVIAAAGFARLFDAELTLVHAWRLMGEGYLRTWGRQSDLQIGEIADQVRATREGSVAELSALAGTKDPGIALIEGAPQVALADFVEKEHIDLMVMGTLCRTGIAGLLIGNTAESLLSSIGCSTLTLKPEGFSSPVLEKTKKRA